MSYRTRYAAFKRQQDDANASSSEAAEWRVRHNAILERVAAEVIERWPHITSENVAEVLKWQEQRYSELRAEIER